MISHGELCSFEVVNSSKMKGGEVIIMFAKLNYDERKLARRKFRKKIDNFVRRGEDLANSSDDLHILIIIHSKELNQIIDFCNCEAPDLISQYQCSKGLQALSQLSSVPCSYDETQIFHEKFKTKADFEIKQKVKKAKLSVPQLSSTRADTEKMDKRSRSPTSLAYSPRLSCISASEYVLPEYDLNGQRAPSIQSATESFCNIGYSPSEVHQPAILFNYLDSTLSRNASVQSPSFSELEVKSWRDEEDLFDML